MGESNLVFRRRERKRREAGIDHPAVENGFISTPKTQEKPPLSVSPYTLGHTAREFENDAVFLFFLPYGKWRGVRSSKRGRVSRQLSSSAIIIGGRKKEGRARA